MSKRIVVFGSFVTDLTARSDGLPTPGQTLLGKVFRTGAGGKGSNQAVAAHRAGANVLLITRIGQDTFGDEARAFFKSEGMTTDGLITDTERVTGVALIIVDEQSAQNQIVICPGACNHFNKQDIDFAVAQIDGSTILVTQLETNHEATFAVMKAAHEKGAMVIFNPAPATVLPDGVLSYTDIITPNETETEALTGLPVDAHNEMQLQVAAAKLCAAGAKRVILTLGERGVYAFDGQQGMLCYAYTFAPTVDTTGAGDAFTGGLAAALFQGLPFLDAIRFASVAAGLSVLKEGTAISFPGLSRIMEAMQTVSNDQEKPDR